MNLCNGESSVHPTSRPPLQLGGPGAVPQRPGQGSPWEPCCGGSRGCPPTSRANAFPKKRPLPEPQSRPAPLKQHQTAGSSARGLPEDLETRLMWAWDGDGGILVAEGAEEGSKHNIRVWQNPRAWCQDLSLRSWAHVFQRGLGAHFRSESQGRARPEIALRSDAQTSAQFSCLSPTQFLLLRQSPVPFRQDASVESPADAGAHSDHRWARLTLTAGRRLQTACGLAASFELCSLLICTRHGF